jgi:hypothetical protein
MAISYLRLTEEQFWDMTPKRFFAMMKEWRKIENYNAKVLIFLQNGGTLPEEEDEPVEVYVHPDAF